MTLNELATYIRSINSDKGFTVTKENIDQKLLLVVSEICEAQEELRDGHLFNEIYFLGTKPNGFPVEIADAIIRLLDICKAFEINIKDVIEQKLGYNLSRPRLHGRKF